MNTSQQKALAALKQLGGQATTWQLAELTGMQSSLVARSLNSIFTVVTRLGGTGGGTVWKFKPAGQQAMDVKQYELT